MMQQAPREMIGWLCDAFQLKHTSHKIVANSHPDGLPACIHSLW